MSSVSGSTGGHNIYFILNETLNKYKHLTDSNDCPTEDEARELREGLTIAADYLYKFRARRQSLRLNNEATKARQEEKAILRIIQNHRTVLSPVRRVPTEIWEEIFTYCGEQTDGLCTPVDPCHIKIDEFPWVLGRVCSRWREIMMDTPAFWTNVRTNLKNYYLCDSRRQPMQTVIQRSKTVPIDLKIESDPNVAQATVTGVARLLFGLRDKIESLELMMPFEHFQFMEAEIKSSALTVLKKLHLGYPMEYNSSKKYLQKDNVNVFATAPRLKQVTICGGGTDFPDKFNLPWRQLEVVEQYLARGDQVLQCISNCPNMHTLYVYETYGMRTDLTILRHDVLRCVSLGEVLLLDYLELPSLVKLTIGYNSTLRSPFDAYAARLERFLGRCGSNLETLVIGHIPFENKGLVPILRQTPRLKKFKIECGYRMTSLTEGALIRDLISSLSIQKDIPILLPFLEELHISVRYEETMVAVVDDKLCRVLDSRVGQRTLFAPLQSFLLHVRDADELSFYSGVSPHCINFLMDLSVREVGVELEIGCPGKWPFEEGQLINTLSQVRGCT